MRLWHGGVPGMKAGSTLLPPDLTGAQSLSEYRQMVGAGADVLRTDRVFVAADREVARAYAALKPNGALYEVRPLGELEEDPDCTVPGLSWQCRAAVVVSVVDPLVWLHSRPVARWFRVLNGPVPR